MLKQPAECYIDFEYDFARHCESKEVYSVSTPQHDDPQIRTTGVPRATTVGYYDNNTMIVIKENKNPKIQITSNELIKY